MPLDAQQIETALAIQSELIASLFRWQIGQGLMTHAEYKELLDSAQGERTVTGTLFLGPLRPLYRLGQP